MDFTWDNLPQDVRSIATDTVIKVGYAALDGTIKSDRVVDSVYAMAIAIFRAGWHEGRIDYVNHELAEIEAALVKSTAGAK